MVPLREAVVFPQTMVPFVVGRRSSLTALQASLEGDRHIFLACQRDASIDEPQPDDVHTLGTIVRVIQSLKVASGNVRMLVEGAGRARAIEVGRTPEGYLLASVLPVETRGESAPGLSELASRASELFERYVQANPALPAESVLSALKVREPGRLCDTLAAHLVVSASVKQDLLELVDVRERLERLVRVLEAELDRLQLDHRVDDLVKEQLQQAQRQHYLTEKMRAIRRELGGGEQDDEMEQLCERIESSGMPRAALDKARNELRRLEAMPSVSAEATVSRTYLDWLLAMPWTERSKEKRNIDRARKVLDRDHHALEEVKERILEHLAVRKLTANRPQGTILCFSGPPGVGKTSLARSIAEATGRRFVRLSLGGVRDEAEIRGHRRTYIGALPGRIVQMMRKAGTRNPLLLLDELDKMSTDFRGDPSAALLEVLDPEQNHTFLDHYLDTEYDLSEVFFVATANVLHTIPPALRDRLEVLQLAGYTFQEKLVIAESFLVPRQLDRHGLKGKGVVLAREALEEVTSSYTREAGVRELERQIARICRKIARLFVEGAWKRSFEVSAEQARELLGASRFRREDRRRESAVGVATGLAWTAAGGELLSPEVSVVPGKGQLIVTGQLGEVMQESAQAAVTFVRSRSAELGIDPGFLRRRDVHVHVPQGAIPKDGPSAGVAIAVALISTLTGVPVRSDAALTGEVTLRGKVLPVGGIKEKVLAAHRAGIETVILPRENEQDLVQIPDEVSDAITVVLAESVDEVLPRVLERLPEPLTMVGDEEQPSGEQPN